MHYHCTLCSVSLLAKEYKISVCRNCRTVSKEERSKVEKLDKRVTTLENFQFA